MKKFLLIAAAFTILGILPSQAVNIADLENARGYAYLYRMNGQNYYAEQRVKVIAGEGNKFEIIGRTYSHQGAQYYMTEYITIITFVKTTIRFNGFKINVILLTLVPVKYYVKKSVIKLN